MVNGLSSESLWTIWQGNEVRILLLGDQKINRFVYCMQMTSSPVGIHCYNVGENILSYLAFWLLVPNLGLVQAVLSKQLTIKEWILSQNASLSQWYFCSDLITIYLPPQFQVKAIYIYSSFTIELYSLIVKVH